MTYTPPTPAEARQLIEAAGFGVQEAADALCVSRRQMHRYLTGASPMPWPSVFLLLHAAAPPAPAGARPRPYNSADSSVWRRWL